MNLYFILFLIVGLKKVHALDLNNDNVSEESREYHDTRPSIVNDFGKIGNMLSIVTSISKMPQPNITIFGSDFQLPKVGLLDVVNSIKEVAQLLTTELEAIPNESCKIQLITAKEQLFSGNIKEWILQLIDASAKVNSGILNFNLGDFGSPQQCLRISENISDSETVKGKYCVIRGMITDFEFLRHFNASVGFTGFVNPTEQSEFLIKNKVFTGVCVPAACRADDLQPLLTAAVGFVERPITAKSETKFPLRLDIDEEYCYDGQPRALSKMNIICLVTLLLYLGILVVCTYWDINKKDDPIPTAIKCFSLRENSKKLFSTDVKDSRLSCLNGIRVLSMFFIFYGHEQFITSMFPLINPLDALNFGDSTVLAFLGAFAVETFFLMSGMLVVYVFFNFNTKWIMVVGMYPMRYARLLPMVAVTILINLNVSILCHHNMPTFCISNLIQKKVEKCEENWWITLLFVQNYVDPDHVCVRPSWYLAVDMQLFLVSPLLLYGLKYSKKTFLFISALAVCAVSIVNGFITYRDNLMPIFPINISSWELYQSTHLRFFSWLIGAIFGYIIVCYKNNNKTISKAFVIPFWLFICGVVCGTIIYIRERILKELYTMNPMEAAIINATLRQLWSISVSLLIFLCSIGSGGFINKFLSLPVFTVTSRLTYSMYLLHSYVMIYYRYGKMITDYYHDWELVHHFLADLLATLILSIICVVSIEMPLASLVKVLLLPKDSLKKEKSIIPTESNKMASTELVGKINPIFID